MDFNTLLCKEIKEEEQLKKVYRLRYDVYVREMAYIESGNKTYINNDMVTDTLDETAHHFAVFYDKKIIAAARYNCSLFSDLEALHTFPEFGEQYISKLINYKDISIIEPSRIVVNKDFRHTYANLLLFYEIMEHAVINYGIDAVVTKIRKGPLYTFYKHYGFILLEEFEKEIDMYKNSIPIKYCFGYLLMDETGFKKTQEMVTSLLYRYDQKYVKRIELLMEKINERRGKY